MKDFFKISYWEVIVVVGLMLLGAYYVGQTMLTAHNNTLQKEYQEYKIQVQVDQTNTVLNYCLKAGFTLKDKQACLNIVLTPPKKAPAKR